MIYELKKIVGTIMDIDTVMNNIEQDIVDIDIFRQIWGTTALGFGGFGGDAITEAYTTVVQTIDKKYYVFFGGRLAYVVETPTEKFTQDLAERHLADCATAQKIY